MARWMALSRASRGWPGEVAITPASATTTPAEEASSTPYPVAASPGSTPMIRRVEPFTCSGRGDGVDDLVGDVVVGVHGLDVVLLLEGLDEPQHGRGILALHAHGGLGHHVDLGLEHGHTRALEGLADRLHFI